MPRNPADFGDGGAYPEVAAAQFPLGMGLKGGGGAIVPLTVDAEGNVKYDAILTQNMPEGRVREWGEEEGERRSELL